MKIDLDEPYSLERAIALNTAIKLRRPDKVIRCGGPVFHEAPEAEQRKYWDTFLGMARERLCDE